MSTPLLLLFLLSQPALLACQGSSWDSSRETPEVYVRAAALTPDGTLIAAGHSKGRVELIAAADGEFLRDLEPKLSDDARELLFSPDGRRLAGLSIDGKVILWAIEGVTGEESRGIAGPVVALPPGDPYERGRNYGSLILWSPDGERLAVADHHGNHSLWSADGDLVRRWVVPDPSGDPQLAWSPDGTRLVTAEGNVVLVRSAETGEPIDDERDVGRIECPDAIVSLALHPGGEIVATGHWESCLRLWNLETGKLVSETRYPDALVEFAIHDIADLAFSPSGDRLALSTREGSWIHVLDVATMEQRWRSGYLGGHFSEVMQLCWSPDGSRLWFAFACGGGFLHLVEPIGEAELVRIAFSRVPRFTETLGVIANFAGIGHVSSDGLTTLIARRAPEPAIQPYLSDLRAMALASSWMRFR